MAEDHQVVQTQYGYKVVRVVNGTVTGSISLQEYVMQNHLLKVHGEYVSIRDLVDELMEQMIIKQWSEGEKP